MAMSYYPYSGTPLTYGMGPEYNFFRDVGGMPSQGASPVVVPSFAAIESGGQSPDTTNLAGSAGGGGSDYSPSGTVLGGVNTPSTPANFDSRFGTVLGTAGSLAGTAAGVPGLGMVGGALGEGIDLARYADVLNAAGIPFSPDYLSAAAYGATSLPFGLGGLLGTGARQQSENARRDALANGRLGDNVSPGMDPGGHTLGATGDIAQALGISDDPETLATMDAIRSQNPALFGQLIGSNPMSPAPAPDASAANPMAGVPTGAIGMGPIDLYGNPTEAGWGPGGMGGVAGGGEASTGGGDVTSSGGATDTTGNGGGNTGSESFGGGMGWGAGKRGGRVTKRGKIKPYADGGAVGASNPPLYGIGGPIAGAGDGQSDSVPALVDGQQPAALSDGEHVVPADVVSMIGSGSTNAGHKKIARTIAQIRQHATGRKRQMRPFKGTSIAQLMA